MLVHIQHAEDRVWVTLYTISLDRCTKQRLRENEIRESMWYDDFCISPEELTYKSLESEVVDFCIRVKKLEVNVNDALLVTGQ